MTAPSYQINESPAVDKSIQSIYANYLQLMVNCTKDEKLREDFIKNPRPFLNEVGMTIPNSAKILLDDEDLDRPKVYIKTKDGKIKIQEQRLGLQLNYESARDGEQNESIVLKNQAEIKISVQEELKHCDVVVTLPFLNSKVDMLGEVKFSDNSEIILSGCC